VLSRNLVGNLILNAPLFLLFLAQYSDYSCIYVASGVCNLEATLSIELRISSQLVISIRG